MINAKAFLARISRFCLAADPPNQTNATNLVIFNYSVMTSVLYGIDVVDNSSAIC